MIQVDVKSCGTLCVEATNGRHSLAADEPIRVGGTDTAMSPTELLAASLGTCTAITLEMYAKRKEWPLESVSVRVTIERPDRKAEDQTASVRQEVEVLGPLDDKQRERLRIIAGRCPVHRMLDNPMVIEEVLV